MKDKHFLELAKEYSHKSNHPDFKIGCVIVKKNKILGTGFNLLKTHPKSPHAFKSVHAEFMAVLNANYDIKNATVYVFRQQKNGKWAISRPCKSCWTFLSECGIKKVVYSFEGTYKQERIR